MEQGYQLLQNTSVADAITALKAARSKQTGIDAAWLLKRLADEAEADLNDIVDDDGRLKNINEWPLIWRKGLVAGIEVEELWEGRGESRENIGRLHKVKLSDRVKRLELIGKHIDVQAFREQVAHTGGVTVTVLPEDAAL
jgi:phage terminase small subunit